MYIGLSFLRRYVSICNMWAIPLPMIFFIYLNMFPIVPLKEWMLIELLVVQATVQDLKIIVLITAKKTTVKISTLILCVLTVQIWVRKGKRFPSPYNMFVRMLLEFMFSLSIILPRDNGTVCILCGWFKTFWFICAQSCHSFYYNMLTYVIRPRNRKCMWCSQQQDQNLYIAN